MVSEKRAPNFQVGGISRAVKWGGRGIFGAQGTPQPSTLSSTQEGKV